MDPFLLWHFYIPTGGLCTPSLLYSVLNFNGTFGLFEEWDGQICWSHYNTSCRCLVEGIFIRRLCMYAYSCVLEISSCAMQYENNQLNNFKRSHTLNPGSSYPGATAPPFLLPQPALYFLTRSGQCLNFNRCNFKIASLSFLSFSITP